MPNGGSIPGETAFKLPGSFVYCECGHNKTDATCDEISDQENNQGQIAEMDRHMARVRQQRPGQRYGREPPRIRHVVLTEQEDLKRRGSALMVFGEHVKEHKMNDREYLELQLRMTIVPQQVRWPAPEYPHWQRLHEVVDEARERVSRAYSVMDQVDCDSALSREGKERQRCKVTAQAIADFEASKTRARAREAVELAVAKHSIKPEARDAMLKALKDAEQGWSRAMDKVGERASLAKGPDTRR